MFIPYTVHTMSRDNDNYSQEEITDTGYLSDDTLEGLYQQITDMCMQQHISNLDGVDRDSRNSEYFRTKLKKISDKDFLNFDYCSSYDNDSYITFGEITLDSMSLDTGIIMKLCGSDFKDLITSKEKVITDREDSLKLYHENKRKEQYLKLKAEFE